MKDDALALAVFEEADIAREVVFELVNSDFEVVICGMFSHVGSPFGEFWPEYFVKWLILLPRILDRPEYFWFLRAEGGGASIVCLANL